jgi:hypothetical protein
MLHYIDWASAANLALGASSTEAASSNSAACGTAAVAAAEEVVLAGEPLSREAAAALQQGAFALYGACSAAEVR